MRIDRPAIIVAASALLAVGSASFCFCPTARATPPASPVVQATAPAPPAAYDDGDGGNELLEHWGDPKYAREERVQIAGLSLVLACLGAGGWRRRLAYKKAGRHD